MDEKTTHIYNAILDGDVENTEAGVNKALESGLEPGFILAEGMIAAMKEVGRRFEADEYFVPEMLISAMAMKAGLTVLKPYLVKSEVKSMGTVAIGTVKGDLHDIGKNLVGLMLEGAGFEVKDLGVDVAPAQFVEAVVAGTVDIVALSALLTTTMPNMKNTIDALQQAGVRGKVKVMVGGAPVTQEYATLIGADGYSPDASQAVKLALTLL